MASTSAPQMENPAAASRKAAAAQTESAAQAWRLAAVQLGMIRAFAAHFLQAKLDTVRLSIRQLVIYAGLGIVGLIALAAVAVMMVVFVFDGIAGGLSELFNGRLWLAELVTTGLFLMVLVAGVSYALAGIRKGSRRATVQKYESRQTEQRINFGTDIHERASRG